MIKKLIYLSIILSCLSILVSNCKPSKNDNTNDKFSEKVDSVSNTVLLTIMDSVKVYSKPENGLFLFSLPFGSKCEVISKGKYETRNNIEDFWYQIEFEGKKGWLFGTSTSLRLKKEFELFLKSFTNELKDTVSQIFSSKF